MQMGFLMLTHTVNIFSLLLFTIHIFHILVMNGHITTIRAATFQYFDGPSLSCTAEPASPHI